MSRFLGLFRLGARSLLLHPLRSFLTVLGIIIGVGAVIYMLAVLEGTAEKTQARIRARGSNNIIIKARKPIDNSNASSGRSRLVVYGLTHDDARRIRQMLPSVEEIVPMRDVNNSIYREDRRVDTAAIGTVPWYLQVARGRLKSGRWFGDVDLMLARPVTILGAELARRLFRFEDPLEKTIRIGSKPFRVIGVMEPTITSDEREAIKNDRAAFIPLSTVRERFGERNIKRSAGSLDMEEVELHEMIVRLKRTEDVLPAAAAIEAMLERFHKQDDYEMDVPLALLGEARKQAQEAQLLFGTIAAISLLVGGIGIMNIMLASVTERTREIGIRRALGALRKDITIQFLLETLTLSVLGGIVGIAGGIAAAELHERLGEDAMTIVTPFSLILSFGISALVGVLAGLYPAIRAARMDPIRALRHE